MSTLDIVENNSTTLKFKRSKKKELIGAILLTLFFTLYYFMLFKHGAAAYEKIFVSFESAIAAIAIFFGPLLFTPILKKTYMTLRYGEIWSFDKNANSITRNSEVVLNMSNIQEIKVKKHLGSDAPDIYEISFCLKNLKLFKFEDVTNQEQADEFVNNLSNLIGVNIVKVGY